MGNNLFSVVENRDVAALQESIQKVSAKDINSRNKLGSTPLMIAAAKGFPEIVTILLSHPNIVVNMRHQNGLAPLDMAAQISADAVTALLSHPRIEANQQDKAGKNALMNSVWSCRPDCVMALLAHPRINVNLQDKDGLTVLMIASEKNYFSVVTLLVEHTQTDTNLRAKDNFTALMKACTQGHSDIVKALLHHPEINVNLQNSNGTTALLMAITTNITIVKDLLARPEIEVNLQNMLGWTALIGAVMFGLVEGVTVLLADSRIDVNKKEDQFGATALMYASGKASSGKMAQVCSWEIVTALLAHKDLNANRQDNDGWTALMYATATGGADVVGALLAHPDIDVEIFSKSGKTALGTAKTEEVKALIRDFLVRKKTINSFGDPAASPSLAALHIPSRRVLSIPTSAPQSPIHSPLSVSWLAARLRQKGVSEQLIDECELKLVVQEDHTEERSFAALSIEQFNADYLKNLGITALGLQQKILTLHQELNYKYSSLALSPPSPVKPVKPAKPGKPGKPAHLTGKSTSFVAVAAQESDVSVFRCGETSIQNVNDLHKRDEIFLGAVSPRLMLRGHFDEAVVTSVSGRIKPSARVNCVIKCATNAIATDSAHPASMALKREFDVYMLLEDSAAARSTDTSTGCISCFFLHPTENYLVLEDFGQDLRALLTPKLRHAVQVVHAIVLAVDAFHSHGLVHGDLKPQNLLYKMHEHEGYVVKICDLDASCCVGNVCPASALGTKFYESPEVFNAGSKTLIVAQSMDMFALGLVLWQVLKRSAQPALLAAEEVSTKELHECYSEQETLRSYLPVADVAGYYAEYVQALTSLEPHKRLTARQLRSLSLELLASNGQRKLYDAQRTTSMLEGTHTMLHTLVNETHSVPTFALLLPKAGDGKWTSWFSSNLQTKYRLYFLCSHTHRIARCGPEGKGFKIEVTKKWVRDIVPVLRFSLQVVQVAVRLSGVALPDMASLFDDIGKNAKFLEAAFKTVMDECLNSATDKFSSLNPLTLEENARASYNTVQSLVQAGLVDVALFGLQKVTHSKTKLTTWILDDEEVKQSFDPLE